MTNVATQDAMTALIRNGGFGGGGMADTYFTRNSSLNWAKQFDTESGALPLVSVNARGSRRQIEKANQNKVVNPTAGTNTTSWDAPGTNSIARVTDFDAEGLPGLPDGLNPAVTTCFKFTFGDDNTFGQITAQVLTAAAHAWSSYIYIPAANTATVMTLDDNGSYVGAGSETFGATNVRDAWDRVSSFNTPVGGDLTGTISWRATTGSPTASDVVYVAMTQVEADTSVTSATAGHLGIGYAWDGAAHASTSQRTVSDLRIGSAAAANLIPLDVGAIAIQWSPTYDSTDAPGNPRIMEYRENGDNRITIEYAGGDFKLLLFEGGSFDATQVTTSFSANDELLLVVAWDADLVYISVNGAAYASAVRNDTVPLTITGVLYLGSFAGGSPVNSPYGPIEVFNRVPSRGELVEWAAFGLPAMGAILP